MATYPSTIKYTDPVRTTLRWQTLVTEFDNGEENRKQKNTYPRRDITLKYTALAKSEMETLWEFYNARKGSYEAFAFFESTGAGSSGYHSYSSEYVGTGDSTTTTFNLPAINSSANHTVYVDGSSSTAYTFTAGGGANGEDQIDFNAGDEPGSSEQVTYSFTGRLKVRCRFAEDSLDYETMYDRLVNHGITLKGLLNS